MGTDSLPDDLLAKVMLRCGVAARALLEDSEVVLATLDLARHEVVNVAVRAWRTPESVPPLLAAIDRIADDGGVLVSPQALLAPAAEISKQHMISAYDAAYAAADDDGGHRLVSCDERGLVSRDSQHSPAVLPR